MRLSWLQAIELADVIGRGKWAIECFDDECWGSPAMVVSVSAAAVNSNPCDAMRMVGVRHRASEALQKPLLHETAGHEFRLWIFDPVCSRAAERKHGNERTEPHLGRRQMGRFASCVVCSLVICCIECAARNSLGRAWSWP